MTNLVRHLVTVWNPSYAVDAIDAHLRVLRAWSQRFDDGMTGALENGRWFTQQMPPVLEELRQVRNPGAHAAVVDRSTAKRWRGQIVGIGCAGLLVELARTRIR